MTSPPSDRFLVAVCQLGAEAALKREVAREHPDLRSAFARPGLVTFKSALAPVAADFALGSVFARMHAAALGPARDAGEVLALAAEVADGRRLRLHVFSRDAHRVGDEPRDHEARVVLEEERLRALILDGEGRPRFLEGEPAAPGDHVLDVIIAPGEPHFVGHHLHAAGRSPHAGGRFPVTVPADAPSRAFRKIEEAIAWSGATLASGQVAVEIGSAPGGASHALLLRGLTVTGIDPGDMSEVVLASPNFRHLKLPLAEVKREQLPKRVDWLLLDVHLAPQVALHAVRGLVAAFRPSLRGVLFTLKLNDWSMADKIPSFLGRMTDMGLTDVRATQLPGNRQEIFAFGAGAPSPGGARAAYKKGSPNTLVDA